MSSPNRSAPRVTVLLCVHNGERYLCAAIESVLAQTYRDFEFLIIDDGSTDASPSIVRSYTDPRIRVLSNSKRIGLTKSLNIGLEHATGELIARHDADDVSHRTRLAQQVAFMDANQQLAVLGTQARIVDTRGRQLPGVLWWKATTPEAVRWQLMFDTPCVHGSVMYRRSVIWYSLGGYDERFITSQDYELWCRVVRSYSIGNLPDPLVDFRTHPESLSSRYDPANVGRIEPVMGRYVNSVLQSDTAGRDWARTWLGLLNRHVSGIPETAQTAVEQLEWIWTNFASLNPEDARLPEIQRHVGTVFARLALFLLPEYRGPALKAHRLAWTHAPRIGAAITARWLVAFCLGAQSRSLSSLIRRARTGRLVDPEP